MCGRDMNTPTKKGLRRCKEMRCCCLWSATGGKDNGQSLMVNRTIDSSRRPKYIVESGVSSAKARLLRRDVGFNTGKQVPEDNALSSTRRDRCNRDQAIVGGVRSVALPLARFQTDENTASRHEARRRKSDAL